AARGGAGNAAWGEVVKTPRAGRRGGWHTGDMHERAGQPAQQDDLIDVEALLAAYTDVDPDPTDESQRVVFGTSGHRGSSLRGSFNEAHIVAISAAIAEYRAAQGIEGPLFIGSDTHPLS